MLAKILGCERDFFSLYKVYRTKIDTNHIIFINFEDLDFSFIRNEIDLHEYIKQRILDNKKYYLFFDEIQNVPNFEKALNSLRN